MNKARSSVQAPASAKPARPARRGAAARARLIIVAAFCASAALLSQVSPSAQRKREGVNVTGVSSSAQGGDAVVSISGDGALSHAQTWQDRDGTFNVVVPYGKTSLPARGAGGVRLERVGDSLQIIVPARPGASVMVRPNSNRLDLVVSGGLAGGEEEKASAAQARRERARAAAAREGSPFDGAAQQGGAQARRAQGGEQASAKRADSFGRDDARQTTPAQDASQAAPPAPAGGEAAQPTPAAAESAAPLPLEVSTSVPPAAAQANADSSAGVGALLFSPITLVVAVLGAGLVALLLFVLRRRAGRADDEVPEKAEEEKPSKSLAVVKEAPAAGLGGVVKSWLETTKVERRKANVPVAHDRRVGGAEAKDLNSLFSAAYGPLVADPKGSPAVEAVAVADAPAEMRVSSDVRVTTELRGASPSLPAVLFGAYRIDQEVGKLVEGMPHSIEVLASRASDDRRAIETSLIKVLHSAEAGEDGKRRARQALEEYGFVARQSAALLLAQDTYDRLSAARVLGQVMSRSSLPFLLEALYDPDTSVRAEVVSSLGSLGLPRAIGALLDMARRYQDIPAAVVAPALTACSFESFEHTWSAAHEARAFAPALGDGVEARDVAPFECAPEGLPEWLDDDNFSDALERLESADVEARLAAAQSLSRFRAGRTVEALALMSQRDESAAVRAAAVTSLGGIDHESVFVPVLLALADDSREVRAAAARAFSGLEFDRADACARTVETADAQTLSDVARACVKSGLAAQSLQRLAAEDRRHAYEAFSLLSMVARGGEWRIVLDAVAGDRDHNVRLAGVRLAGLACVPELSEGLRELVSRGGLPEAVRAAILEAVGGTVGETA